MLLASLHGAALSLRAECYLSSPLLAQLGEEGLAGSRRVLGLAAFEWAPGQTGAWDSPGHRQPEAGDQPETRPGMKINKNPRLSAGPEVSRGPG